MNTRKKIIFKLDIKPECNTNKCNGNFRLWWLVSTATRIKNWFAQ